KVALPSAAAQAALVAMAVRSALQLPAQRARLAGAGRFVGAALQALLPLVSSSNRLSSSQVTASKSGCCARPVPMKRFTSGVITRLRQSASVMLLALVL